MNGLECQYLVLPRIRGLQIVSSKILPSTLLAPGSSADELSPSEIAGPPPIVVFTSTIYLVRFSTTITATHSKGRSKWGYHGLHKAADTYLARSSQCYVLETEQGQAYTHTTQREVHSVAQAAASHAVKRLARDTIGWAGREWQLTRPSSLFSFLEGSQRGWMCCGEVTLLLTWHLPGPSGCEAQSKQDLKMRWMVVGMVSFHSNSTRRNHLSMRPL